MSSQITPFNGPCTASGPPHPARPSCPPYDDSLESEPPHEVLDQIETAGRISRQLRESGQEMRFSIEAGGRVKIELQDRKGKIVRSLLASEAMDIAAGKTSS